MTALGPNSVIRRCRLNVRFARKRTWLGHALAPRLSFRAAVASAHVMAGEPLAYENLPHVLAVGLENAATTTVIAALSTFSFGRARTPDLRQLEVAPIHDHLQTCCSAFP